MNRIICAETDRKPGRGPSIEEFWIEAFQAPPDLQIVLPFSDYRHTFAKQSEGIVVVTPLPASQIFLRLGDVRVLV